MAIPFIWHLVGGGWKVTLVSVCVHFFKDQRSEIKMDTELENWIHQNPIFSWSFKIHLWICICIKKKMLIDGSTWSIFIFCPNDLWFWVSIPSLNCFCILHADTVTEAEVRVPNQMLDLDPVCGNLHISSLACKM